MDTKESGMVECFSTHQAEQYKGTRQKVSFADMGKW
jgi:hypothetical protein